MRSKIQQWFASSPMALNVAFSLMFATVVLTGAGISPFGVLGAGSAGP